MPPLSGSLSWERACHFVGKPFSGKKVGIFFLFLSLFVSGVLARLRRGASFFPWFLTLDPYFMWNPSVSSSKEGRLIDWNYNICEERSFGWDLFSVFWDNFHILLYYKQSFDHSIHNRKIGSIKIQVFFCLYLSLLINLTLWKKATHSSFFLLISSLLICLHLSLRNLPIQQINRSLALQFFFLLSLYLSFSSSLYRESTTLLIPSSLSS